ncbi:hypothetical protein J4465_03300 [Candidatus Pacearchaeota archaeon]|nr:hypothetical protein [Candidatus Pacearchaeota archaeon]
MSKTSVFVTEYWQNNYQIERIANLIERLGGVPINQLGHFVIKREDEFKKQTYLPIQKEKALIDKADEFWIVQGKLSPYNQGAIQKITKTYNLLKYTKRSKKPIKYCAVNHSGIHVGQGREVKERDIFTEEIFKEIVQFQKLLK